MTTFSKLTMFIAIRPASSSVRGCSFWNACRIRYVSYSLGSIAPYIATAIKFSFSMAVSSSTGICINSFSRSNFSSANLPSPDRPLYGFRQFQPVLQAEPDFCIAFYYDLVNQFAEQLLIELVHNTNIIHITSP